MMEIDFIPLMFFLVAVTGIFLIGFLFWDTSNQYDRIQEIKNEAVSSCVKQIEKQHDHVECITSYGVSCTCWTYTKTAPNEYTIDDRVVTVLA